MGHFISRQIQQVLDRKQQEKELKLKKAENDIETGLRKAMQPLEEDNSTLISQPKLLQDNLDIEVIMNLFQQYKNNYPAWHDENIDNLCKEILRSHVRVLAMLILCRMGHTILDLRRDKISDKKLPLVLTGEAGTPDLRLNGQADTPLKCFQEGIWYPYLKTYIFKTQWCLNVPYMSMESGFVVKHMNLQPEEILPWCKSEQMTPNAPRSAIIEGGYSRVKRVHIHPDYHGFRDVLEKIGFDYPSQTSHSCFALKILEKSSDEELEKMYQNEIQQLKSFNGTHSPHLVTLLTTFTHRGNRHFLFPWATCDLSSYWEKQPQKQQSQNSARWLSKQFMGLAEALKFLHRPPHIPHKYARHGDLKPDNILWYQSYRDDPDGILVISDMGFTVVHRTYSRSNDHPSQVARTPDYRPPELDTKQVLVSQKYDVWTLGCIFLEMLVWFLGGKNELEEFRYCRHTIDQRYSRFTHPFFTLTSRTGTTIIDAEVQESVLQWMEKIRTHENRSQFTDEIVNIIKEQMIVVDADQRGNMDILAEQFTKANKKCQTDGQNYCIVSTPSASV
ncbi:kinase-like domain-containing protein [Xylariaceae sp. AK1471]|nr:kinase-like domain-containing protein [Xylariaceae sp. AK1471]